jgi:hypothetical protein
MFDQNIMWVKFAAISPQANRVFIPSPLEGERVRVRGN